MILTPHMLTGAAVGSQVPSIGAVFLLSVILHYLMDGLPHREYQIESLKDGFNKQFVIDALKVAADFFFALGVIFLIAHASPNLKYVLVGALAAALPDFLLFLLWQFNGKFLKAIDELHHHIHPPRNKKTPLWKGVATQVLFSAVALFILLCL